MLRVVRFLRVKDMAVDLQGKRLLIHFEIIDDYIFPVSNFKILEQKFYVNRFFKI